jgi:phosphoadenosine phosphosulfate reductase
VDTTVDVGALADRFERQEPEAILRWALETVDRIAIASAFQAEGTVVIHLATRIRPDVPILFLETGFQFAETLAFKQRLTDRLHLNVVELVGEYTNDRQEAEFGPRLYERDPEMCCEINKVRPMFEALRGLDAWITSVRRDSSPTRADTPIVDRYELEPDHDIVKVNPMATWSRQQVWGYLKEHDLPRNPLYDLGYSSIGCAPCTRLRFAGEPERAGRWAGIAKWECGIHVDEASVPVDEAGAPRGDATAR